MMSFFSSLFGEKKTQSLALLDVHAGSIGVAYVLLTKGAVPQFLYNTRALITPHQGEILEAAMERTLGEVGATLIKEGAPKLLRATGSGAADVVLCSTSAPWQETLVRKEHREETKPYTFTRAMIQDALQKNAHVSPTHVLVNEFVVGTILNGYETADPIGKRVTRSSVIVLSSSIEKNVAETVAKTLRGLFHTKDIVLDSGSAVRFRALRYLFPHEGHYLVLDAEGTEVMLSLVRHGLLVSTTQVNAETETLWAECVRNKLSTIAKDYPLPRTIFLIARENEREAFTAKLQSDTFSSLWLSAEKPAITSVLPTHLTPYVKLGSESTPDVALMSMTLYASAIFADA